MQVGRHSNIYSHRLSTDIRASHTFIYQSIARAGLAADTKMLIRRSLGIGAITAALAALSTGHGSKTHGSRFLSSASSEESVAYAVLQDLIAITHASTMKRIESSESSSSCTPDNIQIRRQWDTLSAEERISYTDAVRCLGKLPAKTPASFAPGAKRRYDDWVATHINQTLMIHFTGTFLGWHRYFTWEYEQALRNECGYKGTQPYWSWPASAVTGMEASPVWDGSATSMSGNGVNINEQGPVVLALPGYPELDLPHGNGGGCVKTGPFKDWPVNMGPAALAVPGNRTLAKPDPLKYNPRCLKRDLTDYIIRRFANATATIDTILNYSDIWDFEMHSRIRMPCHKNSVLTFDASARHSRQWRDRCARWRPLLDGR